MLNTSVAAADPFNLDDLFAGLAGDARAAVAVSGGSDSMALLRLATDWCQRRGVVLFALTVDHALRAESAGEAQRVAGWCAALGVEHHVLRWEGEKPRSGVQAAARMARYDLLAAWCGTHGVDVVMTAHTEDDQAETVMMRQRRTASAKSLSAIWPETKWKKLRVVRPLLGLRRAALRSYLRGLGQAWIDDPSNEDVRFERVRVRQRLELSDIDALAHRARIAQVRHMQTQAVAQDFWSVHGQVHRLGFVVLPRPEFAALAEDVAQEVLARAVFVSGSGARPERASLGSLVRWIKDGHGRRTLAGAIVALRARQVLVAREAGRITKDWQQLPMGILWDGRFAMVVPSGALVGPALMADGLERPANMPEFVWKGLPAVKLLNGEAILAPEAAKSGISATFCERIWF